MTRARNGLSLPSLRIIDRAVKNRPYADMGLNSVDFEIDAAASLLGWWRDAGVDVAIGERPYDWLGTSIVPKAPEQPLSLQALIEHLMIADIAEAGPPRRRLRPAGDPTADLMVLVDFPDAADIDAGVLLADPVFDKMLTALDRNRASIFLAPLCPGRPVTGRLSDQSVEELAILARQLIAHIAPKRLWLVGTAATRAILGISDAQARGRLHSVNLSGTIMSAIATAHPRMFDGSKARKSAAWTEMQRLLTRDAS